MASDIDYVAWIEEVLRRKPHLNQSGLARHMGRHRSVISAIMVGRRTLKAKEIAEIASYLGEAPPETRGKSGVNLAPLAGVISAAWYEEDKAPVPLAEPVACVRGRWEGVAQSAYRVETAFPDLSVPAGAILLAVPADQAHQPKPGQVVVCLRERAGLENLTLARASGSNDLPGRVIAIAIELRVAL
jgi:hypothetical protein